MATAPSASLNELIRQQSKHANRVDVVGERPLQVRWAVTLGLLMGLSLHTTQQMGAAMDQGSLNGRSIAFETTEQGKEAAAPAGDYRVEVMDPTNARTITSVHMDPNQWSELEQRAFLRKLVIQADQRSVSLGRDLIVSTSAADDATQIQAVAFLKQAIVESGIALTSSMTGKIGATNQAPMGLRFDQGLVNARVTTPETIQERPSMATLPPSDESVAHRRVRLR